MNESGKSADRDRYARAVEFFNEALALPEGERFSLLDSIADDVELRALVDSMLKADEAAGDDEERPLVGADRLIAGFVLESSDDEAPVARMDLVPDSVGAYRIIELIGSGGMGVVYLAEQETPRRRVALKIVRPEAATSELVRRFRLEAEVLGRLTHDGIAKIHEAGHAPMVIEDKAVATVEFIAMEYVDGVPLDEWNARGGHDLETKVDLMAGVVDAVHAAHESGVIHRDLKPQNILVRADGNPKIIDFGVARLTDLETMAMQTVAGAIVGTLSYMSPEQVGGRPDAIDERSDVYSLGVVLYEQLASRLPYDVGEKSIAEAAQVIRETVPIRPSAIDLRLSGDLENIIGKALEKEPERRYATARDLAVDLRRWLAKEPVSARPPSALYVMKKFARRHAPVVAGAATALAALILGTIVSLIFAFDASEQADIAERRREHAADAAYLASLRAAALALEKDDYAELEVSLSAAPKERRGWEWRHFRSRLGRSETHFANHAVAQFGDDGELRYATIRGGRRIVVIPALDREVVLDQSAFSSDDIEPRQLKLSFDGRRVMSFIGKHLVIWDADSGAVIASHEQERGSLGFEFLGKGRRAALLWLQRSQIVDLETGDVLHDFESKDARAAVASADGSRVYVADEFLTVAGLGAELKKRKIKVPNWPTSLAISPDASKVAMIHLHNRGIQVLDTDTNLVREIRKSEARGGSQRVNAISYLDNDTLVLADVDDSLEFVNGKGETLFRLPTPLMHILGIAVSSDRSRIAAFGLGGCHVVDLLASKQPMVLKGHEGGAYAVAVSADGSMIASGGWDHHVVVRSAVDGRRLARLPIGTSWHGVWERTAVQHLAFEADGAALKTWAHKRRRFDLFTGDRTDFADPWENLCAVEKDARISSFNNGISIVSSHDGRVRTVNEGHELPRTILVEADVGRRRDLARSVSAVALSPDGKRLAFASADGLELRDRHSLEQIAHQERRLDFLVLEYTPDGSRIVSGTRDGVIRIWDATTLDLVARLPGHTDYVYSLRFSPDGTRLYSAGGDGTVRVWDTVSAEQRRREAEALDAARVWATARIGPALMAGEAPARILADIDASETTPGQRLAIRHLLIEAAAD